MVDGLALLAPFGLLVMGTEEPPGEVEETVVGVPTLALVVGASTELVLGVVNDEDEPPEVAPVDEPVVGVLNDEALVVGVSPFELLVVGVVKLGPLPHR